MTSKVTKAKNLPSFLNDFFVQKVLVRKQRRLGILTNDFDDVVLEKFIVFQLVH